MNNEVTSNDEYYSCDKTSLEKSLLFITNVVCCSGIDKQRVHQLAVTVRSSKPPEPYKGKGLMYIDEVIKKKQGKKSK